MLILEGSKNFFLQFSTSKGVFRLIGNNQKHDTITFNCIQVKLYAAVFFNFHGGLACGWVLFL